MSKLVVALLAIAGIALTVPLSFRIINFRPLSPSTKEVLTNDKSGDLPALPDPLKIDQPLTLGASKILTLEAKNTIVLSGPIESGSVSKVISQLKKMSGELSSSDTIYLVMNTPGGSVFDGADLIDFLAGLPQKVKTVTMFAASMGFQIVENNPGERLITRNGILMSHRAALSGLAGQLDGELESEYKMIRRETDYMEAKDCQRLGIDLPTYREKIRNEWWIHGFDAVSEKVADETILLQCGETMSGTTDTTVNSMFGPITVTMDNCPLITAPVAIHMDKVPEQNRKQVEEALRDSYNRPVEFIKTYLNNGSFYKLFK